MVFDLLSTSNFCQRLQELSPVKQCRQFFMRSASTVQIQSSPFSTPNILDAQFFISSVVFSRNCTCILEMAQISLSYGILPVVASFQSGFSSSITYRYFLMFLWAELSFSSFILRQYISEFWRYLMRQDCLPSLVRQQLVMRSFLSIFWSAKYRSTTCFPSGMKWSLGHMNLVCLVLQLGHLKTQNSSNLCFDLSRSWQYIQKSRLLYLRMLMRLSYLRLQMTEYMMDLTRKGDAILLMKLVCRRKGFSPSCTATLSMIRLPYFLFLFRERKPSYPVLRMSRSKLHQLPRMSYSGCEILVYMIYASEKRVFSIMLLKKIRFWKTVLFASFKQSTRYAVGNFSTNWTSSYILNNFLIFTCSSIQLLIFQVSSQLIRFLSANFLKIFRFLPRQMSCERMLEMSDPTQLMLQERTTQLSVSMRIMQQASLYVTGTISPKPIVSMRVVPQQQAQMYCSYHSACAICLVTIQFCVGLILAISSRMMERMWAKQKLKSMTLTSDQYCSQQQFSMKQTYSFYSFCMQSGNLKRVISRRLFRGGQEEAMLIKAMIRLAKSKQNPQLLQQELISRQVESFLPKLIRTVVRLITISRRKKRKLMISMASIRGLVQNYSKTMARLQMKMDERMFIRMTKLINFQ